METSRRLTIIVPAAGLSSRIGSQNKLLLPCGSSSVLGRVVSTALSVSPDTIVVTGEDREAVSNVVRAVGGVAVHNDEYEHGMATSIVCGIAHAGDRDFIAVWPADMPLITAETARLLMECAVPGRITVPTFDRVRGHPVVFSSAFRVDLLGIEGDVGARSLLRAHAKRVDEIPVNDSGILFDVDTAEDYAELIKRLKAT